MFHGSVSSNNGNVIVLNVIQRSSPNISKQTTESQRIPQHDHHRRPSTAQRIPTEYQQIPFQQN